MYRLLSGLVLGAVMLASSPALALDQECLWENLSPGARAGFEKAIASADLDQASDLEFGASDFNAWPSKCGVTPALQDRGESIIVGTVIGKIAVQVWRVAGLDEAVLVGQWEVLTPAERTMLARIGRSVLSGGDPTPEDKAAADKIFSAAVRSSGARTVETGQAVIAYMTSRGLLAEVE